MIYRYSVLYLPYHKAMNHESSQLGRPCKSYSFVDTEEVNWKKGSLFTCVSQLSSDFSQPLPPAFESSHNDIVTTMKMTSHHTGVGRAKRWKEPGPC